MQTRHIITLVRDEDFSEGEKQPKSCYQAKETENNRCNDGPVFFFENCFVRENPSDYDQDCFYRDYYQTVDGSAKTAHEYGTRDGRH